MRLCKSRHQRRHKAKEKVAFWVMLGIVTGVGTVTVAARWLQKKNEAESPEFAPSTRRSTGAAAPSVDGPKVDAPSDDAAPPEPAAESEPVREVSDAASKTVSAADKLTKIEGIGPKISGWLNQAGITTFAQLAATTPEEIGQILSDAGHSIANPETWPEQAALAAAGQWDELKKLQGTLKGGRRVS